MSLQTATQSVWRQRGILACGVFLLVILVSSAVWAQESQTPRTGAVPSGMLEAYGSVMSRAEYEGTLYCLRHDFSQDKKDKEICQKEGHHHHALMMADGHVHPLYGQTQELNKQINAADVNAKKVKIRGKYYPVSNAIMVESMTVLEE